MRSLFRFASIKRDTVAGLVLGGQSVPDGLAGGLLAGVNPVFGLYGYLFGMVGAAFVTGSEFMTVQATGAMAAVVADVDQVHNGADTEQALFTLATLTGVVMIAAALLRLGGLLRFVPNSVMVGFISGVGVNIVLGQLDDFTGYEAEGSGRVAQALDLLFNLGRIDWPTLLVGVVTVVAIVTLEKTPLGALSLVVAVVAGSVLVPLFGLDVAVLGDTVDIPNGLPTPRLPDLGLVPGLLVPAASLAFVGLIQGAGITANFPNPDGAYADPSRDFMGQGAGNLVAGAFQGMPVGGSMSATSVVTNAGSRSRVAQLVAGAVMAVIIVGFADLVEETAMPALAGLLIVVGVRTVKADEMAAVWRTGRVPAVAMTVTFVLTILIPLQFAVLLGVALAVILHVVRQSQGLVLRQLVVEDGGVREADPPAEVEPDSVVVVRPYGSLFFASSDALEELLPAVTDRSRHAVVILRLRGRSDLGSTLTDTIARYASSLADHQSRLVLITDSDRVRRQLALTGVTDIVGDDGLYESNEWLHRTTRRAYHDALEWVAEQAG